MATIEINVHPTSSDPNTCVKDMEESGRYKNLNKLQHNMDIGDKKPNTVRFVAISDTHNTTDPLIEKDWLPDADVLLHSGDFTLWGKRHEIEHFNDFCGKIKHKYRHIVVIPGNHELTLDPNLPFPKALDRKIENEEDKITPEEGRQLLTNCTLIQDETIVLHGVKIYGAPWAPIYGENTCAFSLHRGRPFLDAWNKIPNDTDILMTHGPALGIGDYCSNGNYDGCSELLSTIQDRVKPKFHIFGHIHEGYGLWNDGITTYANVAISDNKYNAVNKPFVFDIQVP